MERVMVIGNCGMGKSAFATELLNISGLPLIQLDQHYYSPNWERPTWNFYK